jgi:hypothetical protein
MVLHLHRRDGVLGEQPARMNVTGGGRPNDSAIISRAVHKRTAVVEKWCE